MPARVPRTPGQWSWEVEQYASGRTLADIGDELGVALETVRARLLEAGVTMRSQREAFALRRPAVLNNEAWLRERYWSASAVEIADELGVNAQMVLAALRRLGIEVRHRNAAPPGRPSLLGDRDGLAAAVEESTATEVAAAFGVSRAAVHQALHRHGVVSPHRYDGRTPKQRPDDETLVRLWELHETVKGVAKVCGVSPTTARVWLARAGCFVSSTAALSRTDLEDAIGSGESLDHIAGRFGLTSSTVVVELHRYGLFDQHRRRHIPDPL